MHNSGQKWMLWVIVVASSCVTTMTLAFRDSAVGDPQALHNTRPPDTLGERLERPRPEQDSDGQGALQAQLRQNEVVRMAQRMAKQTLGMSYEKYVLKRVMFDQKEGLWFVTFSQGMSDLSLGGCLIVVVHDDSRATQSKPCL